MRLPCLLLLSLALLAAPAAARPKRIVSLNLCADQYLLALADPGQIAALTLFARDPQMSAGAAQAAKLPVSRGSAEDVLALEPELIIASPWHRLETVRAVKGSGLATLDLPSAESYDAIVAQIRQVAAAVGHPARGEALIKRMNASLAALPEPATRGAIAAYYQRRGFLTGTGTLVDELMTRAGLVNLATRLDGSALSRLSVEQMVAAKPDYLILETATRQITDQGTEMLHHPALSDIRRLYLPQAWTVCGGPAYVLAAESLAKQLRAAR
ncbi:ABC transporter substrate-binding protein [Sphingoaurantiacus capsulatus]|uniref:ABC transporter substrate-binding protein n=1 Tax=Sphingoaurantiacus capsulatus TaxID=1771310 RepID=A0ABV7XF44_9SPHN